MPTTATVESSLGDFFDRFPDITEEQIAKELLEWVGRAEDLLAGGAPVDTGNMQRSIMSTVVYHNDGSVAVQAMFHRDQYPNYSEHFYPAFVEYGTPHTEADPFVSEAANDIRSEFTNAMKGIGGRARRQYRPRWKKLT